jgi:hypothetical protein
MEHICFFLHLFLEFLAGVKSFQLLKGSDQRETRGAGKLANDRTGPRPW